MLDNFRVEEIIENSFLGKILEDEKVTDIRFNGTNLRIQHNELGYLEPEYQPTAQEVGRVIKQIAMEQGKDITNSNPILDTEFEFLRLNAVHDAVSPDGNTFAIRVSRPRLAVASIQEMSNMKNMELEQLVNILIQANSNIVISGRTGSGKTELQKLLVGYIPDYEPIVLIEDTRDSHIKTLYPEKDIMSWQTLLSDDRDKKVTIQDLVRAGLRNNPEWMIVAETRGEESADLLDSAKTDHSVLVTLHAKGAMNIPSRLIPMIRQSPSYQSMDEIMIGKEIVELLRFGIHLGLSYENGKFVRKIKEIVEFTDFTRDGVTGNYLFKEEYFYDEKSQEYKITNEINPLSEKTLKDLENKKLIHLLPSSFKRRKKEEVVIA